MNSFFIVLGIALWIILAFWPAVIARKKGYSFVLFLLTAIFFSWIISLIIVLFLKDKNETAEQRADDKAVDAILDEQEHER